MTLPPNGDFAVTLVCGTLAAQTSGKTATSVESNRTTRLLTVSSHSPSKSKKKKSSKSAKHGQQKIDPSRAREIQAALIREHYMNGEASGTWDSKSEAAMQRYQSDNGWQSKVVPDSRALTGPDWAPITSTCWNPESAMTSYNLDAPHAAPASDQSRGMERRRSRRSSSSSANHLFTPLWYF